jgi:hypothetical protein
MGWRTYDVHPSETEVSPFLHQIEAGRGVAWPWPWHDMLMCIIIVYLGDERETKISGGSPA